MKFPLLWGSQITMRHRLLGLLGEPFALVGSPRLTLRRLGLWWSTEFRTRALHTRNRLASRMDRRKVRLLYACYALQMFTVAESGSRKATSFALCQPACYGQFHCNSGCGCEQRKVHSKKVSLFDFFIESFQLSSKVPPKVFTHKVFNKLFWWFGIAADF